MTVFGVALAAAMALPEPIPAPMPDPTELELQRFPSLETAKAACEFCCEYERFVRKQQAVGNGDWREWEKVWRENEDLWPFWLNLRLAHESDGIGRRDSLSKLRAILGDDAYFRGELPPPVPIWRFAEK